MSDDITEYGRLLNNRKHVSCIKNDWRNVIKSIYKTSNEQTIPSGYYPVVHTNERPDYHNIEEGKNVYYQYNIDEQNNQILKTYFVSESILPVLMVEDYECAVQDFIDNKVREKGYDNVYTCLSYKGDPDPIFSAEADAVLTWRSTVWRTAQGILNRWIQGEIEKPTIQEVISQLPTLTWPNQS